MNTNDARALMMKTLERYAPIANNKHMGDPSEWSLNFREAEDMPVKNALGTCNIGRKIITINAEFVANAPKAEVIDTILHECAHALCGIEISPRGRRMAHGKRWKSWARRVGASPSATTCSSKLGEYGENIAANKVKKLPKWVVVADRGDHLERVSDAGRKMVRLETKFLKSDYQRQAVDGRAEALGHVQGRPGQDCGIS